MKEQLSRRPSGGTLGELLVATGLLTLLGAAAAPAYLRSVKSARTAEAVTNVRRLYDAAASYYEAQGAPPQRRFPPTQGPTPAANACCGHIGQRCAPLPEIWDTPTWQALHFSVLEPHYYWYTTMRTAGTGAAVGDRYELLANGNLNCDAVYSGFRRMASVGPRFTVVGSELQVWNEEE